MDGSLIILSGLIYAALYMAVWLGLINFHARFMPRDRH